MDIDRLPLHQIFDINLPPAKGWQYPKMFKEDSKGATRVWYAGFDGRQAAIMSVHGQLGGKLQESEPYVVDVNTSGRSLVEQAVLELKQRYEIKHRKEGYRFAGESPPDSGNAMASYAWDREKDKLYFPVAIQPKLDGIRCMVKMNSESGVVEYRSRGNKMYNFEDIFDSPIRKLLSNFPFNVELDGELYIHGKKLQAIASIVNTRKAGHPERKLLQYYIFGVRTPMDMIFEERMKLLSMAFEHSGAERIPIDSEDYDEDTVLACCANLKPLWQVRTRIAANVDDIDEITDELVECDYEGTMIYKMGKSLPPEKVKESYYKGGRSKNILKNKPFFDEEGTVVAVSEGKGIDKGKAMVHILDQYGVESVMTPAFDHATRTEWFKHPDLIIGKTVTFKHFGRTKDNQVRHANMIAIRDYE
jgi:hypothetical protein